MADDKKKEEKQQEPVIAIPGTDITEEQLAEYRKEFKKIFKTYYIDDVFVWHRINRKTYVEIVEGTESIEDEDELMREREKQFVQKAVLYPDQEKLTALLDDSDVIADTLSQEILFKSGFYRPVSQEV